MLCGAGCSWRRGARFCSAFPCGGRERATAGWLWQAHGADTSRTLALPRVHIGVGAFTDRTDQAFPAIPVTCPTILAIIRVSDVVILGGATAAITDTPGGWDGMAASASSARMRLTRMHPSQIPHMPTLRPTTRARRLPTNSSGRLTG